MRSYITDNMYIYKYKLNQNSKYFQKRCFVYDKFCWDVFGELIRKYFLYGTSSYRL